MGTVAKLPLFNTQAHNLVLTVHNVDLNLIHWLFVSPLPVDMNRAGAHAPGTQLVVPAHKKVQYLSSDEDPHML